MGIPEHNKLHEASSIVMNEMAIQYNLAEAGSLNERHCRAMLERFKGIRDDIDQQVAMTSDMLAVRWSNDNESTTVLTPASTIGTLDDTQMEPSDAETIPDSVLSTNGEVLQALRDIRDAISKQGSAALDLHDMTEKGNKAQLSFLEQQAEDMKVVRTQ